MQQDPKAVTGHDSLDLRDDNVHFVVVLLRGDIINKSMGQFLLANQKEADKGDRKKPDDHVSYRTEYSLYRSRYGFDTGKVLQALA